MNSITSRLAFFLIVIFWVTMNVLLWRSQMEQSQIGSAVPAEVIWKKILTAPEKSSLEILHHGKKIGTCRLIATVGASSASKLNSDDYQPEGMVATPSGYSIDLAGNASVDSGTNRLRFDCQLTLGTNDTWQEFHLRASLRPITWELHAVEASQTLRVVMFEDGNRWERTFKLSDFENPEPLIEELGGPVALGLMLGGGLDSTTQKNALSKIASGLKWHARNDWMRFGHSQVRVFRLEARLLGSHQIYIFVSRVGEILWVHLPDELVLSNDDFSHF